MRIADLIHGLDIRVVRQGKASDTTLVPPQADLRVCDITEDSRTVMPGSLFVARKGEKTDGKQFIAGAIEQGACAILIDDPSYALRVPAHHAPGIEPVILTATDINLATAQLAERFYGDPSSKMTVIGVTGTNGKTTTTFLIHQMLNQLGIRCGLVGTVVIDDGTEVAPASLTTPPALELSRTFARMLEAGCRAVVMEASSHALHQKRVGGEHAIRFNAGVFTNLTGDHLDYHKTMDSYATAKAMLFEGLPDASQGGVAVLNVMDTWHTRMKQDCKARVLRCVVHAPESTGGMGNLPVTGGKAPETVWRASVLGADTTGTDIEIEGVWSGAGVGHRKVRIPLVGAFNVMNALQAIVTVHALYGGTDEDAYSFDIIAGALEKVAPPPGRLEPVTQDGEPVDVFVDYAHTDDALQTVLKVLRGAMVDREKRSGTKGELWCVFGCGGDRDRTKRPRMGKVASELADRIVITSDNPRTEDPMAILAEIQTGIVPGKAVTVEPDRERAIQQAIRSAKVGDVIIIAGKGHEDYQILPDPKKKGATITRHFDDREVSRAALAARGIKVREPVKPRVEEAMEEDTV